jgi:ArpU family phage transcriptional regulator|nr:MAG TPA: transcriptional regulator [Caudoviricetes sp.]
MSLLFPEINKKRTLENVSSFFKKDLPKLLLMSGRNLTDLSSPKLSAAPGSSNFGNANEDKLINGIDAEAMVEAVYDAIHHCSYNSEIILIELFVNRKSWGEVQRMVYSEQNKFSYLRRRAMFEFANSFDYWQRVHHCQPIIDLKDIS